MKNRFIYIILVLLLSASSCNKWLEMNPRTEVPTEDMFAKEQGFKDALIACYTKLVDVKLYGESLTMLNIEFMAQHYDNGGLSTEQKSIKNFEYKATSSEKTIKDIYAGLYNVIVQANIILDNIETRGSVIETDQVRDAIKAEALAIRAFCHLDILRIFGQMPNNPVKKVMLPYAEKVTKEAIPYYSFAEYTKKLEVDMVEAERLFKKADPSVDYSLKELNDLKDVDKKPIDVSTFFQYRRFRFNYYAVKALQARMYNYVGEKSKAMEAAKAVIEAKTAAGNKYMSLSGNDELKAEFYSLPSECLLAFHDMGINKRTERYFDTQRIRYYLSTKAKNDDLFAGRNGTNNRSFLQWGSVKNNKGVELHSAKKYVFTTPMSEDLLLTEKQFVPILRLSEMYLVVMESTNSIEEFNRYYKEYMLARDEQVNDVTDMGSIKKILLAEYRIEFWGEGQMFYTYKRFGETNMMWKTDRAVGEEDYIVPVPSTEPVRNN